MISSVSVRFCSLFSLLLLLALSDPVGILRGVALPDAPQQNASAAPRLRLLPRPQSAKTGSTPVCLPSDFAITFDFRQHGSPPDDLLRAVARTQDRLRQSRHRYLSVERGEEFFASRMIDGKDSCKHSLDELVLSLVDVDCELFGKGNNPSIAEAAARPIADRPELERYRLVVPEDGSPARLEATSALGLFRGLTSFEQLFYYLPPRASSARTPQVVDEARTTMPVDVEAQHLFHTMSSNDTNPGVVYAPLAPYEIEDWPDFGWRGMLLDTSRNFFGIASLEKMLDAMSLVKMNVFHWHITDSNSWPLDLQAYPELAARGSYGPDKVYTEDDVRHLIAYAGERGVDVMLEVDTPGHTASIHPSHPEHIACFEKTPWSSYALQPPAGQLRFASKTTQAWASGLISNVARLVKGRYMGVGGDEINRPCMENDEATQTALIDNGWTLDDALDAFSHAIQGATGESGKTPVIWQEVVLDHGPMHSLSLNDTLVQIWKSSGDARRVLDKGFKIVHAPADYFYLDCGHGGWLPKEGGSQSWCEPYKTWARMYSFDPFKDVSDDQQRQLVMGGQACLWAEQADETNVETLMWPRSAALAELFWSGNSSLKEALQRMHDIRYRLVDRGIRAVPLQPEWCALRPGQCMWEETPY